MPNHLGALIGRGEVLRASGQWTAALADFDHALVLAPDDPDLLVGRADILQQMGRSAEAIRDFTQALDIVPDHLWALLGRGVARRMENDLEASLADFDRAVRIRAWGFADLGAARRNPPDARAMRRSGCGPYARVGTRSGKTGGRGNGAQRAFRQLGRFVEAVEDLNRARAG